YGLTTTESAAAFAIFGNQGVYHKPTTYYKIERPNGEIVLQYDDTGEQVIGRDSATIMNHLLQEVVYGSEGTGHSIAGYSSMKAYAKTGTSSESNDLWMVAGTPYYIGSVWYGFDLQSKVNSGGAAKIWREVMRDVHKDLEKKEFEDSEDVVKKGIGYYKKNGRMDNPIYQSDASSEESSVVSSEVITDTSSVASSDTPSEQTPSAPSDSTSEEPTTPSDSSSATSSSDPDESAASSKPAESSKPTESSDSSSSVTSSTESETTQ
ncbi:MAG: penicillin-binding transpeptidase domain-containing protein, partial [Acutalibacteraceae bacterium]|nr:penicillin-binding transpeptidase domain-containing protein [Acutalibacteraceae bacterium]